MRRKFYTILRDDAKSLAIVPENTPIVALQPRGERPPLFMVDSFPYFIDVVKLIGNDQPVLSLVNQEETQTSDTYSIADEAKAHVRTIVSCRPFGPYLLGGCSSSGIVAFEVAQQLRALGHDVGLLVLFESPNPYFMREYSDFWMSVNSYRTDLSKLSWSEIPGWVTKKFRGLTEGRPKWFPRSRTKVKSTRSATDQFGPLEARAIAARNYRPAPYSGRFLLIKRDRELIGPYRDPHFGWGEVVQGEIETCKVSSANHLEIFKSELDRFIIAQRLCRNIDAVVGVSSFIREPRLQPSQTHSQFRSATTTK